MTDKAPGLATSQSAPREAEASLLDSTAVRGVAYLVGPATIFLLVMTYLMAPEFYLTAVIEPRERESQLVEILTFLVSFAAGVLLVIWIWNACRRADRSYWKGIAGVGVVAAATLFFAGEEISWGQIIFGWETPDSYRRISSSTNLHNSYLPVHDVGAVFLLVFFFIIPLVWSQRRRMPWVEWSKYESMVAEGPVVLTMAVGLLWPEAKNLYQFLHEDYLDRIVYVQFFEQLNEHKELIVANALGLYAIFRFRHRFAAGNA